MMKTVEAYRENDATEDALDELDGVKTESFLILHAALNRYYISPEDPGEISSDRCPDA